MTARIGAVHIPGEQCTAKVKSTGKRCRRLVVGGGVCRVHGGATQAATAKRLERIALAEQMARQPHRHPGEILMDALHLSDVVAQAALKQAQNSDLSPKQRRAINDASMRSATLARSVLSAESEATRAQAGNELQAVYLKSALTGFMLEMGLQGQAKAEEALLAAVGSVASKEWMPLSAAAEQRKRTLNDETGAVVAEIIKRVMHQVGIPVDRPWPASQVIAALRSAGAEDAKQPLSGPPHSWWAELAQLACEKAGFPDPVPVILPPQRPFALTAGGDS